MATPTANPYKNYIALTAQVSGVEHKTSKAGKPYAVATATVAQNEGQPPLSLRVVALDKVSEKLAEGVRTLVGRLGYEEDRDGRGALVLYPSKVEDAPADGRARNYANLTLRVGADPYAAYSRAGRFWARLRAFLSMGKAADGEHYKPSLWLTVKAFDKDGDESLPSMIAALGKGEMVTFTGRLAWEVYKERGSLALFAFKAEALAAVPAEEECRSSKQLSAISRQQKTRPIAAHLFTREERASSLLFSF
jgi:hypothetical protein